MKKIHNSFVIVHVDKAAYNYAIIGNKFYTEKIEKELGNTNFWTKINIEKDHIIKFFSI